MSLTVVELKTKGIEYGMHVVLDPDFDDSSWSHPAVVEEFMEDSSDTSIVRAVTIRYEDGHTKLVPPEALLLAED